MGIKYLMKLFTIMSLIIGCFVTLSYAQDKPVKSVPVPKDMVLVPAGEFIMGNNNDYYDNDYDEKPQHLVNLPAFYIDKYLVTNAQYKKFVEATIHQPPIFWDKSVNYQQEKSNHPVVGVTYLDAKAYCAWAGKRLPTEEEWEKASRGTDARRWPWGNVFEDTKANISYRGTTPVGNYPEGISPYGCYDMAGNVFEWTDSWYELYSHSPENKIVARLLGKKYKVVRGGSYNADIGSARCSDRGIKEINDAGISLGFRCAKDVPGYEHYRNAVELMNQTENIKIHAKGDITDYEEHESSRLLLKDAEGLLNRASESFKKNNFEESEQFAQQAKEKIQQAHQLALDFTKNKRNEKIDSTKKMLDELEAALKNISDKLSSSQLEIKNKALDHFKQAKQFFEEGSLGYAQMHVIIGFKIVGQIKNK